MHAVDPAQVKKNRVMMTTDDIIRQLQRMASTPWLTLTGGDPCLHKGLDQLISQVYQLLETRTCVETQGELWPDWLKLADVVTFSPKGPSSGNVTNPKEFATNLNLFRMESNARIAVKVVVFDSADLQYARDVKKTVDEFAPGTQGFYFQVGSPLNGDVPKELIEGAKVAAEKAGADEGQVRTFQKIEAGRWKRDQILKRYDWLVDMVTHGSVQLDQNTFITPQTHTLLWPMEERGR